MKIFMTILILSLLSCFQAFAARGSLNVDVKLSPAGSFEIKSSRLKGKAIKKGESYKAEGLKVKVSSLKTGMDLRNNHLHDKLGKKTSITLESGTCTKGKGKGVLIIKKVSKPISFTCKPIGDKLNIEFKLNLPDFKITGIKYMGVGVKDVVNIKAMVPIK